MSSLVLTVLFSLIAATQEYRVIVHPSNPATNIERRELADMFLKKVRSWSHGERVAPADLPSSSSLREKFATMVLNRTVSAVKSYWQQQIFSGRGLPPPELDSEEAVVQYVLKNPGAVAYVSTKADIGAAKVLVIR
jgi:ABC-type phosphate transport system substrate-binding protein